MQLIVLSIYLTWSYAADSIDWCRVNCNTEKNTMCEYKPQHETKHCRNIIDSNTPGKRKQMLDLHNEYRNKIAGGNVTGWPAAANMRELGWDDTLEKVALRWAQQCKGGHDLCRRTPEFEHVGQNYGLEANSAYFIESSKPSFDGWVQEIQSAKPSIVDSFQSGKWNHFTQLIWALTTKVGCAQTQFVETKNGMDWKTTVTVCNYGTMGNMIDQKVYERGKACSKCSKESSCSTAYPNLCTTYAQLRTAGSAPRLTPMATVISCSMLILNQNLICW